jgi:hypothetical protein
MAHSPDDIVARAGEIEALLRDSPSPESIEGACALVDSMLPDVADEELIAVATRFRALAAQVGCKTPTGVISPERLHHLAQRLAIVAEAARRRQKLAAPGEPTTT